MAIKKLFVPNRGFAKDYETSDEGEPMLADLAERAAGQARNDAPERTGNYRASIEGITGFDEAGIMVGRVVASDFKAHWIEAGTGPPLPTPPRRVLAGAVEKVVGKVGK